MSRTFNGTTDRVDWSSIWNPGAHAVTISAWIKPDLDINRNEYIFCANGSGGAFGVVFNLIDFNVIDFVSDGSTDMVRASSTSPIVSGAWQHILVTHDGTFTDSTTAHLYVSGTEPSTTGVPGVTENTSITGTWSIGGRTSDDTRNFDGRIAEVAVWDRVLTAGEIANLASGYAADRIPSGIRFYITFDSSSLLETVTGATGTADGTSYDADHPTITHGASPSPSPSVSPSVSPSAGSPIIVDINHEAGNLAEYTSTANPDATELNVTGASALGGTSYGLAVTINDTDLVYGEYTMGSPDTSGDVRWRFYLDPNSLSMTSGDEFRTVVLYNSGGTPVGWIVLNYDSVAGYRIQFLMAIDSGFIGSNYYAITDAPHYIEAYLIRATGSSTNDGSLQGWIDGVSKETLSGEDNYDAFSNFNRIRVGAVQYVDATTSGTLYLDEIIVNNDGSAIGAVVASSASVSPSVSPSRSPSASVSPSVSRSLSPSASVSPSVSPSAVVSASASRSPSRSASPSASVSPSVAATYWYVPTGTTLVDGFSGTYAGVQPGDVICLNAGVRGSLTIKNIIGTPASPIIITNCSGLVDMNTASGWVGFYMQNCSYVRFTGTGDANYEYGIRVSQAVGFGLLAQNKTDNIEIDHFEVRKLLGTIRFGIHILTNATTVANYDYNGDGVINPVTEIVNRGNWTCQNIHVHDNLFDGTYGVWDLSMAMYIGNSNMYIYGNEPQLENIEIDHNICRNIASKVIQLGSCISGGLIHDNTIDWACWNDEDQVDMQGINVNDGIGVEVYNNWVSNVHGHGIATQALGGKYYNNLIFNCGVAGTIWSAGIHCSQDSGAPTTEAMTIVNNTIVNVEGSGIEFGDNQYYGINTIKNNIIVDVGAGYQYIDQGTGGTYVVSNNLQNASVGYVLFVDPVTYDFHLQPSSPARNAGTDVSAFGVTFDASGNTRPMGTAYDQGCYEFVEGGVGGSPSVSPSVSPSRSPSISASPSLSPSASRSPSASVSPSFSPSRSPSASRSPSISVSPSISPSRSPSASASPSISPSRSPSASFSTSPSASPSPAFVPEGCTVESDSGIQVRYYIALKDQSGAVVAMFDNLQSFEIAKKLNDVGNYTLSFADDGDARFGLFVLDWHLAR